MSDAMVDIADGNVPVIMLGPICRYLRTML